MRILICDDDPLAIEQIHKNLKSFFTYKHIKCPEVISYSCGEDLLNDTGNKDIVFLDIEMPFPVRQPLYESTSYASAGSEASSTASSAFSASSTTAASFAAARSSLIVFASS